MNLLPKFSLIFTLAFALCLLVIGVFSRRLLEADAREQVHDQAKIIMDTAMAVRDYTAQNIQPLLNAPDIPKTTFRRETVPAFGATEIFLKLRKRSPDYADYSYKEATLNPTNPRDQAQGWEEDVVNDFRLYPEKKEIRGERATPTGDSLYLAHPIVVSSPSCLKCHDRRDNAPPEMIKEYSLDGTVNGFGWKEGEIIGAQIVSVPVSKPLGIATRNFWRLMIGLAAVGCATLAVLNVVLYLAVIRPIKHLSANADSISKGIMDVKELPVQGRNEVSVLAAAFNRMHRSLAKAIRFMEKQ
jgi:protein-histidine pros-kinase